MAKPSSKQVLAYMSTLMLNLDLDDVTTDQLQEGIGNPKRTAREFTEFVRNKSQMYHVPPPKYPVWKTVTLGIGKQQTGGDFVRDLTKRGVRIDTDARELLNDFVFNNTIRQSVPYPFDLVRLSVRELGFENGASYKNICTRAEKLGLELCPAEVGPQLCLVRNVVELGGWINIAMGTLFGNSSREKIFSICNIANVQWLRSCLGSDSGYWTDSCIFIFVRPRK